MTDSSPTATRALPGNGAPGPDPLEESVSMLSGVGPERAALLAKLDIATHRELLLCRPRRYEDRRQIIPVRDLELGKSSGVRGKVISAGTKFFRQRSQRVFELILEDGSARLHCRWWNLTFIEKLFAVGDELFVFGKCQNLKPRTIDHPEVEKLEPGEDPSAHIGRVVPVYPLTEGLNQRFLRSLVSRALESHAHHFAEPQPSIIPLRDSSASAPARAPVTELHVLSAASTIRWPSRSQAIRDLHFPEDPHDADLARRRLALDEFIELQWKIQRRRKALEANAKPLPCAGDNHLIRPFLAQLPFRLTSSQTQVLREIRSDLGASVPMRRLLQGDVGAGKTLVAACAALMAIESGRSVLLMAPTEILAEQLWANLNRWFEALGLGVALRTGAQKKTSALPTSLVVGTHALIEHSAEFENIGLVIIDEQHKFGVGQREALVRKGSYPHLLVMTATPIPRTLGLTLYGDLDVSVLTHLPEGRGRVQTHVRSTEALPRVWKFVAKEVAAGRQAYVVYPRVIESNHDDVKAVTREHERLRGILTPHSVGLLHGQLPAETKDQVMQEFRSGAIRILLATSIIEVGVDVPNATVMVIENAEQFGLAQLHQLRGRIGRGSNDGHCILVSDAVTEEATRRLQTLAKTSDGFEIAEADLRLRGPGELTGKQQSGLPPFRFGDLVEDRPLVELARDLVQRAMRTP